MSMEAPAAGTAVHQGTRHRKIGQEASNKVFQ
jgi:hypothetical protein